MNLLVRALRVYVPQRLVRRKLHELFEATAAACGTTVPDLTELTAEECLERYALFCRTEIGRRIREGEELDPVRESLYQHAFRLGRELRTQLRLTRPEDVLSAGTVLYRSIGIDFEGKGDAIVIHSCFFSRFFDAALCGVMSSLDTGIAAGLSGGGRLTFTQRITEGKPRCEAIFELPGSAA
jgi:hypothetical protein